VELRKKNIHMNKLKCKSNVQLTLDDDFNVPDIKPDIEKIIKEQGTILINEIKPMNGKVMVKGSLHFNLLYISEDDTRPIHNIIGELPFDEMVNMDEACTEDNITVKWELDDFTTSLINSRKVSVRSIVSFTFTVEDIYDEETAIGIEGDESINQKYKKIDITQIVYGKKDTLRIKDEIVLSAGKPNIYSILYNEIELRGIDFRMVEDKINMKGELFIYILYTPANATGNVQYYETELPFTGVIDCNGCDESMVSDVRASIFSQDLQIKPDEDGEERIIDLEVVIDLDIKVYEEEELEILSDVYSTSKEIIPVFKDAYYENLVLKNNSKTRIVDRIVIENGQPKALQICNATGSVRIDEKSIVLDGIQVEGVVEVQVLYITEEDDKPLGAVKGIIPFTQIIEVKNMKDDSIYNMKAGIEQISVMMLDGEEIEAKVSISLDTMVFDKIRSTIITDIKVEDLNLEKLHKMPGIIGYVVKPEDSLWMIAKKFYTTVDSIKDLNGMETDFLKIGDKLLLMKEVETVL
jgi:hypothetical protein